MKPRLTRWVHRDLPRCIAPRNAKALHEAARVPPMDYRDNRKYRAPRQTSWPTFTPPCWSNFAPPLTDLKEIEFKITNSVREVVLDVLTRGNDSIDPVGAAILKNAFIGRQQKVVLMLTDTQLNRLSREYPQAFMPFVRL